ncbi:MAG: hypothetical protein A2083_09270 [Gemmatimonadetes bacterium GWC2_71_9]|nr:MAG: hypothetical protein A2083_09270 [Gemmatimonadetes bacterium GWC2_71_9]
MTVSSRRLAALLLVTLGVRLAFVFTERFVIYSDLLAFDQMGLAFASGDFGDLSKPPLYGMFLGAIYAVAGHSYLVVGLAQALLGTATGWLLYRYTSVLHGDRAGLVALGLFAVYPDFVVYPGMLLSESLFVLLLVASLWLLATAGGRGSLAIGLAGALIGLATLTRATLQFFSLVIAGLLLYRALREGRRPLQAAFFLAAFALALAPWTVRNYLATGRFVPVYADAWHTVWIGNNPDADGTYMELPSRFSGLSLVKKDSLARSETLRFVRQHPARVLSLAVKKVSIFWSPKPDGAAAEYLGQVVGLRAAYVLLAGAFVALALLAALGIAFLRDWRGHAPFLLLALYFTGIHAASHVGMRYRLPLVPFLLSYAAYGLVVVAERRGSLRGVQYRASWGRFAALAALFAANTLLFVLERGATIADVLR